MKKIDKITAGALIIIIVFIIMSAIFNTKNIDNPSRPTQTVSVSSEENLTLEQKLQKEKTKIQNLESQNDQISKQIELFEKAIREKDEKFSINLNLIDEAEVTINKLNDLINPQEEEIDYDALIEEAYSIIN